jgi:two-component system, OmpR family, sensor kinase
MTKFLEHFTDHWSLRNKLLLGLLVVNLLVLIPMGAVLYWRVQNYAEVDLNPSLEPRIQQLFKEFQVVQSGFGEFRILRPPSWCTPRDNLITPLPGLLDQVRPELIREFCNSSFSLDTQVVLSVISAIAARETVSDLLTSLRGTYLIGAALLLLLATAVGLVLVNQGLKPLERISARAAQLKSDSLSERLDVPQTGDEVQQVALSINAMLARLEAGFSQLKLEESRTRQFAADASHELRTPVTALQGYLELLARAPDNADTRARLLAASRREGERINRLIADLLTITRLDAGESLQLQNLELAPWLEHFAERVRDFAPEHRILVNLGNLSPTQTLSVDAERLEQALWNLVSNAVKYGDAKVLELFVTNNQNWLELGVFNPGAAIPTQVQNRLFERFYRAPSAFERGLKGVGLGLSIVQAIATAHKAKVFVHSPIVRQGSVGTEIGIRFLGTEAKV